MAKEVEPIEVATVEGMADVGFEWETAHVEAARQISFDTDGDTYIGLLVQLQYIDSLDEKKTEADRWFLQAKFEDPQGVTAINCGYELETFFAPKGEIDTTKLGNIYRIERKRTVDTGRQSPMVSFRIDVAKPRPVHADNTEG